MAKWKSTKGQTTI